MAQRPGSEDPTRRTWLAEERTWLAWWRTGLTAVVAAIGVGRFAPELVSGTTWPYVALGCAYAVLALVIFIAGFVRHREASAALEAGRFAPLPASWVGLLAVGGATLTLATLALILL